MISVIIPVLNEHAIVGAALESLLQEPGTYEAIVVDRGSVDGTCSIVREFPVQWIPHRDSLPGGFSYQVNRGARRARGDILLFLHVDVQLPPLGLARVEAAMMDRNIIGGGFEPCYHGSIPESVRPRLALVENAWKMRTRLFSWFAGDSAPFIRRDAFRRIGGYPAACFAADWDFAKQLRGHGQLAVIREPVQVDCRRLVQNGVFKTILITGMIELMYHFNVERAFLRSCYRKWLPLER